MANQTIGLSAFILHERSGPHTYDQAGLTYDQLGILYDNNPAYIRALTSRANLINPFTYTTIQLQGRLLGAQARTLSLQSRIINQYVPTLSMRTFIRNTGTLQMQGRISIISGQSINFGGRITPCVRFSAQARLSQVSGAEVQFLANLRPAGHIQMHARILHYHQESFTGQARISQYSRYDLSARGSIIRMSFFSMQGRIKQHYVQPIQLKARISRHLVKTIRIRGKIWPYSRFTVRARIKDVSWKRRYINALTKPLAQGTIPGRGDVLRHTNGNIYCVYADAYLDSVCERRLFLSISTDNGITWGTRIQLTSGYFDNAPSLLQLDTTSTTSDIGIAFLRGDPRNIYRLIFTVAGTVSMSPQPIMYGAYTTNNAIYPNLVRLNSGKYRIYYLGATISAGIYYSDSPSTVYTGTTQWSTPTYKYPGGSSGTYLASLSVRRHADSGHLIAIVTYMAAKDGKTSPYTYMDANMTYTLGMTASADEGVNWSAIQVLVTSPDSHLLTLAAKRCPISGDFTELSDGSIGLLYQEGDTHQIVDTYTAPSIAVGYVRAAGVVYDASRGYLIVAEHNIDSYNDRTLHGGLQFCTRNAQGVFEFAFRIEPRSTPPIWSTLPVTLELSPDSRYLLAASAYGIAVLDMQAADHEDWTFQDFRRSTLPNLKGDTISWAAWASNTRLAFGYDTGLSTGANWGGAFDITDPVGTFTDLATIASVNNSSVSFNTLLIDGIGFAINNRYLVATDVNTGALLGSYYYYDISNYQLVYDSINSEFIVSNGQSLLHFVKFDWTTHTFTLQRTLSDASGNPRLLMSGHYYFNMGDNIVFPPDANSNDFSYTFYNPATKTTLGVIHTSDIAPGLSLYTSSSSGQYGAPKIIDVDGKKWAVWYGGDIGLVFMPLVQLGKLRYGVFVYNQTTKLLDEGDAAFYDIESVRTISADDYSQVEFPRLISRTDGALIIYCRFSAPERGTQPFAPVIALGWTDGMTLSMKSRLILPTSIYMRGRISFPQSTSIALRSRLIAAGHIQMQGRIMNSYGYTISSRGRILQNPVSTLDMKALVRGAAHLSAQARVLRTRSYTFTVRARVLTHPVRTLALRGRLVRLQGISMVAHLIPKRSLYMRGKISFSRVKTLSLKAHLHHLGRPTLSMTAIIRKEFTQTFTAQSRLIHGSAPEMRGRISQRQGWPVPESGDDQWYIFTETALRARGSIADVTHSEATISGRARVKPYRLTTLSTMAKLVTGQNLQMRAKITAWRTYVYLPCSFNVRKLVTKRIRMVFYTQGFYGVGILTAKARIVRTITTRFTGHFIVPIPATTGTVLTFNISGQMSYMRQLSTKAFILDR